MGHVEIAIFIKILTIILLALPCLFVRVNNAFADEGLIPTITGVGFCGNSSPVVDIDMSQCTAAMVIPAGPTSSRPSGTWPGMVRYNTTNSDMETYSGGNWTAIAPQVQANWTEGSSGAMDYIQNKPSLATVATSGSYTDLTNTPATTPMSFNNAPSHTIQTVAAAGNGWQISSTRNAEVSYSVLITVTASISSGQSGYVVLEICPTNSSTAGNWLEIGRTSSSQIYTLAIALQGVQGTAVPLEGFVPAGYYVRLRSVNVTGAPTYSFVSGQEVLM